MCRIVAAVNQWIDRQVHITQAENSTPKPPEALQPQQKQWQQQDGGDGSGASGGDIAMRRGDPFSPLPAGDVWSRARRLDFSCMGGRKVGNVAWTFTQRQWNRLQHYFSRVYVPCPGDESGVPQVTVLELYISYVITNGMHRFHSGISAQANGEWLSSHLDRFLSAIQMFQGMVSQDDFVHGQGAPHTIEKWPTTHLPPSPILRCKLLLPNWEQTRQEMCRLARDVPPSDGTEPPHAEMWRRLSLGKPNSQNLDMGSLPTHALIWSPLRRFAGKAKPTLWMQEIRDTRSYRASLRAHPVMGVEIGGKTVASYIQESGVANAVMLGKLQQTLNYQVKRLDSLVEHAKSAVAKKQHVSTVADVGKRPQCVACQQIGTLSKPFHWLRTRCGHVYALDMDIIYADLQTQRRQSLELLQAISKLRC